MLPCSIAATRAPKADTCAGVHLGLETRTHMVVSDGCHRHTAWAADAMVTSLHAADDGHDARNIKVGVKGFLWSPKYQQCNAYCTAADHVNATTTFLQHVDEEQRLEHTCGGLVWLEQLGGLEVQHEGRTQQECSQRGEHLLQKHGCEQKFSQALRHPQQALSSLVRRQGCLLQPDLRPRGAAAASGMAACHPAQCHCL